MALDPHEYAEELVEEWEHSDDDRSLSEYLLLDPGEYSAYVREEVLPEDFVARHRLWADDDQRRLRIEARHPLDRWAYET